VSKKLSELSGALVSGPRAALRGVLCTGTYVLVRGGTPHKWSWIGPRRNERMLFRRLPPFRAEEISRRPSEYIPRCKSAVAPANEALPTIKIRKFCFCIGPVRKTNGPTKYNGLGYAGRGDAEMLGYDHAVDVVHGG
jgi:hypothetical protein